MADVVNDGTLVRGSINLTINSVTYVLTSFDDDGGQPRTELDYDASGKPLMASHVENFRMISGVIRARSDQAAPPKFVTFSYDSKNWYIKSRKYTGSTEGLKQYAVEIQEQINASLVTS